MAPMSPAAAASKIEAMAADVQQIFNKTRWRCQARGP